MNRPQTFVPSMIYRYEIPLLELPRRLELPPGAEPVLVALSDRAVAPAVAVWFLFPMIDESPVVREFEVYGTGHEIPAGREHLGSWIDGPHFVWHLFERHPDRERAAAIDRTQQAAVDP